MASTKQREHVKKQSNSAYFLVVCVKLERTNPEWTRLSFCNAAREAENKIKRRERVAMSVAPQRSLGTLRNNDSDSNSSVESNRFSWQNNYIARASRFFLHFFAVPTRLRREMTKF